MTVEFTVPPQQGITNKITRFPKGTVFSATIINNMLRKLIKANFVSIDNTFGLPKANLVLVSYDRPREEFNDRIVTEYDDDPESIETVDVKLEVEENEAVVKLQHLAIARAYDPELEGGGDRLWLPLLMSRVLSSENLPITDPLVTGMDPEAEARFEKAFESFHRSDNFNAGQKKAIKSMRKPRVGAQLIRGPGGTGKTHVMVAVTSFIIEDTGWGVFISTQIHEMLDHIALTLAKRHSDLKVMRISADSLSGISNLQAKSSTCRRRKPILMRLDSPRTPSTSQRRVLSMRCRGVPWLLSCTKHSSITTRSSLARRAVFQGYGSKLRNTPLMARDPASGNYLWSDEDKRKVRQAYRHLADEVMSRQRAIVGTVYAAAARDYREFGSKLSGLTVMLDEALTLQEASTLIPLLVTR
ncbi:hypothetical protein HII31_12557 [Pseudocercospora fuligena]|uniref:DNA2/NAM7 helicase helicase domain-containing protein n=1 Tax=Pseudocercospora fuligena TaxID=685502 RepID=A0A8H6R9S5_9PEZI|nr:hypothetical protein HII31_12557 [Pseudocercospora fuligena]